MAAAAASVGVATNFTPTIYFPAAAVFTKFKGGRGGMMAAITQSKFPTDFHASPLS